MVDFKQNYSLEKRKIESERIRNKYPDRVPVIVEKSKNSNIPDIDKKKFLVPKDISVGQFLHVVRKRIKLKPEEALFMFVNNTLPPNSALMSFLYDKHKDEDLFLYITINGENTFG